MKYLLYLSLFMCWLSASAQGSDPQSFCDNISAGFDHYELSTKKLKSFTVHVRKSNKKGPKPLLVYLQGSTTTPLYYTTKQGSFKSAPLDIDKYADDYHVVLISKPKIPLCDAMHYSDSGMVYYPKNEEYEKIYSLDWRVESASYAIDFLSKKLSVDKKKLIVMGFSEGAQVAPRIALENKKVTHVICFGGNVLNHFYDFIIEARLKAQKGEITYDESQRTVDSLYDEYEKIYADPLSTTKNWYGDTYLKWSSFCRTAPIEDLLKLDIPILYISGAKDNNQTIIDTDYAKLEFMRKGKTNFSYKVYPNADHFFQEEQQVEGEMKMVNRITEVHQFALDWVSSKKR